MKNENASGYSPERLSVVIFQPQVRDQLFAAQVSQRVLQLHQLNEQVVFGVELRRAHRAFEIERQPLLNPAHPGALRQVHKQSQIQDDRRGEDRITAQEIDLDLHRVTEPAEDIDVVP